MEDNKSEEITIKIIKQDDIYCDKGIWKDSDTNLPLNGKYGDGFSIIYYFNAGKWHNENGPAIIRKSEYIAYCINGKAHRIDGPAAIYSDGDCLWYINGYKINKVIMENWLKENDIPLDWNVWSNEDKMLFALHWSDYSK